MGLDHSNSSLVKLGLDIVEDLHTDALYACPIYPSLSDALQDRISIIVRNYVPYSEISGDMLDVVPQSPRVCGSWVIALPALAAGAAGILGECLDSAMNVLAMSITSYNTNRLLLQPVSLHYGHTLRLLQQNLQQPGSYCYRSEQAAAVMCLALVEVLLPTSANSWLVHIHGVSELIRLSIPDLFSTGIQHKLFIGIRPLMIIKALIFRKATFLADKNWTRRPFQHHKPSPLQSLLSLAATVPEILQKIDTIKDKPVTKVSTAARKRLAELAEVKAKLEAWGYSFETKSPVPLYWSRSKGDESNNESLWFPNLSVANALTHLWAFQIICLSQIQGLLARFPGLSGAECVMQESAPALREACIELGAKILQSTRYLMQQELMLYGPFSAGFPVYTAQKALEVDERGRAALERFDKLSMDRINIHALHALEQASSYQRSGTN